MIQKTVGSSIKSSTSCLSSLLLVRRNSHSRIRGYESNGQVVEKKKQHDGLFLQKSKGQHLLTNTRILDSIVRSSDVRPTDTVLEIGPGTGNLTMKLLEAAHHVVAVELDKRMVEILRTRVSDHGFQHKLTVHSLFLFILYISAHNLFDEMTQKKKEKSFCQKKNSHH